MKKTIALVAVILIICSLFTACNSNTSIYGTWVLTENDAKIEYTFNEDGTGNVRINDTLGYLRYTYENGIIDLSVTVGDKTETNKGQAIRIGDVLYLENADGKPISMAWFDPVSATETSSAAITE